MNEWDITNTYQFFGQFTVMF